VLPRESKRGKISENNRPLNKLRKSKKPQRKQKSWRKKLLEKPKSKRLKSRNRLRKSRQK